MISSVDLRDLAERILSRLPAAGSVAEVDALEAEVLGAGAPVAEARRSLRDAPEDVRRELGRAVNEVTAAVSAAVGERRSALAAAERDARLVEEWLDMTLPGRAPARGRAHLVSTVWDEIVDIFVALGYTVASGPEVETAYYNFDALNTPPTHPSRLESDTLYVAHGPDPEGVVLRTHTSPVQARYMELHRPPIYVVVPGRVYRRDAVDATHTPVFHQFEGLAVDEAITFGDLKGTLHYFAREFFGSQRKVRFLPHFFPFTEPSAEMHVDCFACDGVGCRVCRETGWIELLGCGVVDPNVFTAVGYDPTEVSGFAFGMGIDRLAMIRYGIPELRMFFDPDLRILRQFP
ncbi:MAG TPA: phenylalanine--tRNA ligase subunit alpha [Acidimicrobiia bacterium]|nr:phenylalanine--tRNA ligase subunit alpha [Acidimicrobiia bacterium]